MSTPARVSGAPTKHLNTFEQIRLAQEIILREASALTQLGDNLPEQFVMRLQQFHKQQAV